MPSKNLLKIIDIIAKINKFKLKFIELNKFFKGMSLRHR